MVEDEFAMGVVDEYDPFNPNDYDAIMKERNKRDDDRRDDGGRRWVLTFHSLYGHNYCVLINEQSC